jgi:hypothetical protein
MPAQQGTAHAGAAGDAMDARGLDGLPVAHGRQDDGQMAGLTCFVRRIEEAHICAPVHAVLMLVVVVLLTRQESVSLDTSAVDDLMDGLQRCRGLPRQPCAQNLAP